VKNVGAKKYTEVALGGPGWKRTGRAGKTSSCRGWSPAEDDLQDVTLTRHDWGCTREKREKGLEQMPGRCGFQASSTIGNAAGQTEEGWKKVIKKKKRWNNLTGQVNVIRRNT